MFTVEDYIEVLAGIQNGGEAIQLDKPDYNLITSLARQTFKGTPYTDRQLILAKSKVLYYSDQLNLTEFKVNDLDHLRMPLREIDRSRWIKIVDKADKEHTWWQTDVSGPMIAIRFTFQKKLITALEKLPSSPAHYDKLKKVQYFEYSERTLFNIINAFKDRNFSIDPIAQEIYDKICLFDSENVVPGIYNFELKNLPDSGKKLITEELGDIAENIILYKDRSLKYGIAVNDVDNNTIEGKIANRRESNVSLDQYSVPIGKLLIALENLKRYKLMVLVEAKSDVETFDDVVSVHKHFSNLINPNEVSVSFRLDNVGDGIGFNNYIRDTKINNKVDKDTRIVYTLNNKLPKPLYQSDWQPDAILLLRSNGFIATRKVLDCYPGVDLVIHYGDLSNNEGYGRYMKRGVQKL